MPTHRQPEHRRCHLPHPLGSPRLPPLFPRLLPQVDLSMEPHRREAMLAGSDGLSKLPQLHVNGRFVGGADEIQASAFAQLCTGCVACRRMLQAAIACPAWAA